jgi:hypothetical protein
MAPLDNSQSRAPAVDPNTPRVLNEVEDYEYTAYAFSTKKKWAILTVVALCQTSMSKFESSCRWRRSGVANVW